MFIQVIFSVENSHLVQRDRVASEALLVATATKAPQEILVLPARWALLAPRATKEDLDHVANQVSTAIMVHLEKSASEVLKARPVLPERLATQECADQPVFRANLE